MRLAALGAALAGALLTTAGCAGPTGTADPAGPDALCGQRFTATAFDEGGTPRPLVAGTALELWFADDGRLVANAGCNTMSGTASLAGGRLRVADLATTEMGCDRPRHEQDQRVATFLAAAPSWRLDGETLVLRDGGTVLTLAPRKARPLAGTTWRVDTLVQGEVAGSTPAGVAATLVFGGDEVTVSGLCNLHSVAYRATGDTLTFELGPLTRMACAPDVMTVENAAVAVLDGQTSYRIDADTLSITKAGKGLRLVAEG